MNKVANAVTSVLHQDEVAMRALKQGWLNLSAYADSIKPEVERITWKEVKKGTIVTALARLSPTLAHEKDLKPALELDDLSLKSPLCDVTFERTVQNIQKARDLASRLKVGDNEFLTLTQSLNEITIIAPQALLPQITNHFNSSPKAVFTDLVGLTVRFSFDYLNVPNIIYAFMSVLAVNRINVIEIVSTCTELSVIINQADMQVAVSVLQKYLGKSRVSA